MEIEFSGITQPLRKTSSEEAFRIICTKCQQRPSKNMFSIKQTSFPAFTVTKYTKYNAYSKTNRAFQFTQGYVIGV